MELAQAINFFILQKQIIYPSFISQKKKSTILKLDLARSRSNLKIFFEVMLKYDFSCHESKTKFHIQRSVSNLQEFDKTL